MKYIKEEKPFVSVAGTPFKFANEDGKTTHDGSLKEVIELCLNSHPFNGQGERISETEWRKINKALDALESGADADGYIGIEDDHYNALKRALGIASGDILRRNSPHLMDIINDAVDKKPDDDKVERAENMEGEKPKLKRVK